MSKNRLTEERHATGKHVKRCRQSLGYNRERMGEMLGFTGVNIHNSMMRIETGNKKISDEKLAKLNDWVLNGLPDDAPKPNLAKAKAKYFNEMRAKHTPREIILKGK